VANRIITSNTANAAITEPEERGVCSDRNRATPFSLERQKAGGAVGAGGNGKTAKRLLKVDAGGLPQLAIQVATTGSMWTS